jgi:hypothetical protein
VPLRAARVSAGKSSISHVNKKIRNSKSKATQHCHYNSDDQFEVESILAHKMDKRGKVGSYLVKWLGYDERSWLPASELVGCKEMLALYKQSQ